MYTMDCLVFFLVIRHGKEKKKRPCEGIPCQGKKRRSSNCKKDQTRAGKWAFFLRLLKWKYLSLGEVINPLMDTTPLTQYTSN